MEWQQHARACPRKPCDTFEEAVARLSCLRLKGAHQREGCEWMLAREFAVAPSTKDVAERDEGEGAGGSERPSAASRGAAATAAAGLQAEAEATETAEVDREAAKRADIRRKKNESKKRQRARARQRRGDEDASASAVGGGGSGALVPASVVDHYLGVRGGILADSVGLGKTFIAIAVVAVNSKRRTLIVTLPSTTLQWCDAIYNFSGMVSLSVLNSRMEAIPEACTSDVIVTTYCCIRERPPWAMRERWDRVILDEGHVVRNPRTATHASLSMLRADIRWVLSATPIHNGDADMKTLLRWVGARPDVTPLPRLVSHLVLRRTMETEKHRTPSLCLPPLTIENVDIDLQEEELQMYRRIEEEAREEARREGGRGRRGKAEEEEEDDKDGVRRGENGDEDDPSGGNRKKRMKKTEAEAEAEAEKEKEGGKGASAGGGAPSFSHSRGGMLRRIGQMRQLCVSPEVMVRARQVRERQELVPSNFEDDDDDSRIDRLAEFEKGLSSGSVVLPPPVLASASSSAAFSSVPKMDEREARSLALMMMMGGNGDAGGGSKTADGVVAASSSTLPWPQPQPQPSSISDTPPLSAADVIARFEDARAPSTPATSLSTKMARLCDMVCADLRADPGVKIVVFTTFLAEMDILARELGGPRRVSCTRIHGGMSPLQRGPSIDMFSCPNSGTSVLLAQIMCMSTGVNLQCASIAYITSPSWNPCIEEQAIGRLHRQGQARPVTVRRLIVRDSIETRCMQVQARKMDVIRSNVSASSSFSPVAHQQQLRENKARRAEAALAALAARGGDNGNNGDAGGEIGSSSSPSESDAALSHVLTRVAAERRAEAEREKKEDAARTPVTALTEGEAHHLLFGSMGRT